MHRDAVKGALVYAGGDVSSYVLAYPSGKLVGTIPMVALGACSDANGNVFLTGAGRIAEFAHGGTTPIATYSIPGTVYACSVDPTTGNIAAVVLCQSGCGGELVVIRPGSGLSPTFYRDANLPQMLYCAYDDQGNVFVDGYQGLQFGIAELPNTGGALTDIAVDTNIQYAEQVQWDGQYLSVETRIHPVVYQVQLSGSTGTVINVVHLGQVGKRGTQSWIQKGKIGVPTASPGLNKRAVEIVFWNYPAGGAPINTFKGFIGGGHQAIDAMTFSVEPRGGPSPSPSPSISPTPTTNPTATPSPSPTPSPTPTRRPHRRQLRPRPRLR